MTAWPVEPDDLPRPWVAPRLLPGDVRELVHTYSRILDLNLTIPQRRATEASRARLLDDGDPLPDVPGALARWFAALVTDAALEPDGPAVAAGRVVLEEVIRSGEATGWEQLQGAMGDLATVIANLRAKPNAGPVGDADGPMAEKGSADGVAWHKPEACPFYALSGAHGAQLEALVRSLRNVPRYLARSIDAPARVLLTGGPGTGKSLGARWVASRLGMEVAVFRVAIIASSWKNRTPRNLAACFDALKARPAVAVIDELDSLIGRRDAKDLDGSDKRTVGAVFDIFDALPPEQIVICCTNLPDAIDPSMVRRLGTRIDFGSPDARARDNIIREAWRAMNYATSMDAAHSIPARLVHLTDGRSGDTVHKLAHDAARRALDAGRDEVLLEDVHAANLAAPREGKLETASPSSLL